MNASVGLRDGPSGPLGLLLSKLERVRRCGQGWIARCPAHEDKTASLSITSGADDRVLLHCFAGCPAAEVVHALGLKLGDLFVRRLLQDMTPSERSAMREAGRAAQWRAALNVLGFEAEIVRAACAITVGGTALTTPDLNRLGLALKRIDDARTVLHAR